MEADTNPPESESNDESEESLVEKGWGIVTPNTIILILMVFGVVGTIAEVAGYWPAMSLKSMFPEEVEDDERSELVTAIYKFYDGVDLFRLYSVHIYLATYILLPYPLLTEKQRVLLTPWLLCGVLRSLLLNLLLTLAGLVLCSSHDKLHYPCLQYSAFKGAEFCTSMFLWTSVHTFYHLLERRKSVHSFDKVLKTIHKASIRKSRMDSEESPASSFLSSIDSLYEELDDGSESTLVERAAMAWIAREILEDDGEYVTDRQFSQYLVLKATMELRQIVKEMADKRREQRRHNGEGKTVKERIKESLEFARKTTNLYPPADDTDSLQLRIEAFDQSAALSRRDPLRRIPPLIYQGKPSVSVDEDSLDLDSDVMSLIEPWKSNPPSSSSLVPQKQPFLNAGAAVTESSAILERTVEVQTDPLTPQMNQLFDVLDQYAKQRRGKETEKLTKRKS